MLFISVIFTFISSNYCMHLSYSNLLFIKLIFIFLYYSQVIHAFCVYNKMEGDGVKLLAFNLFVDVLPT